MKHNKNLIRGIVLMATLAGVVLLARQAQAAGVNLISNASVESASNGVPTGWVKDAWGTNKATFAYLANGYNSAHSLKVTIRGYSSGDAKWYPKPVAVSPSTDYSFSDSYRANRVSHVVAMFVDTNGNEDFTDVAVDVPASATAWGTSTGTIHTPANIKKLSILHLIEGNGWLQTDNFNLVKAAPIVVSGLVPNSSLEQAADTNPSMPASWFTSSWGTNKPTYSYEATGHTGNRSVKLTMASYIDGDAKWEFTPQVLQKGADYRAIMWYKTNTIPHVVAHYTHADGSEDFFGMPDPQPVGATTNWQQYSDVFSVPSDAVSVDVFMFLSGNGWLQTDDYSLAPYTYTGFSRPLVSLTFDDGFEENVTTVLPKLNAYGFKSTQCYATQYVQGDQTAINNVLAFKDTGHEICSHSVTHPWLTKDTPAQMDAELLQSKQFLESITGQSITTFASPYGDYNAVVNTEIAKYYASHRTTDEGFNSKDNLNPYRLRVQNMMPTTTLAQYQAWLDKAKVDRTWLILVYHMVGTTNLDTFDTYESDFIKQLAALKTSGITVKTWKDALSEVASQ